MAQSPRDTVAQSPRYTMAQSPIHTLAQSPDTRCHNHQDTQWHNRRDIQYPKLSEIDTCSSWAIFSVVRQRVIFVLAFSSLRVGGPNVTASCPYPALMLDKLYAALVRCLVLWTVTKQILLFLFKGLYLRLLGPM